METKRNPRHDSGRLITSGILSRLNERAQELPDLLATASERMEKGMQYDPEIEPVDQVEWINQLAEVTRAYQAAHQLVQAQDELLGQTIASFGRF